VAPPTSLPGCPDFNPLDSLTPQIPLQLERLVILPRDLGASWRGSEHALFPIQCQQCVEHQPRLRRGKEELNADGSERYDLVDVGRVVAGCLGVRFWFGHGNDIGIGIFGLGVGLAEEWSG
jgi:hypothetical protein